MSNEVLHNSSELSVTERYRLNLLSAMHPVGGQDVSYTPEQIAFIPEMLRRIDGELERLADGKPDNPLVKRVMDAKETRLVIDDTSHAVADIMKQYPNALCIPLLYGTTGIVRSLEGYNVHRPDLIGRIHPLVVERSQGTTLGSGRVIGTIDQKLLDRPDPIIIVDDLLDKGGALAVAMRYILEKIDALPVDIDHDLENIANSSSPSAQSYRRAITWMGRTNVVIGFAFGKNTPLLTLMRNEARHHRFKDVQSNLLAKVQEFGKDQWIMGEHIDTGLLWSDVAGQIRNEWAWLFEDEHVASLVQRLDTTLLRVGNSVAGIIALKEHTDPHTEDRRYAKLLEWTSKRIMWQIRTHTLGSYLSESREQQQS